MSKENRADGFYCVPGGVGHYYLFSAGKTVALCHCPQFKTMAKWHTQNGDTPATGPVCVECCEANAQRWSGGGPKVPRYWAGGIK